MHSNCALLAIEFASRGSLTRDQRPSTAHIRRFRELTGAMAPTSSARGLAAMAEEDRPCWAGAKAAADATTEARIIDFMVGY